MGVFVKSGTTKLRMAAVNRVSLDPKYIHVVSVHVVSSLVGSQVHVVSSLVGSQVRSLESPTDQLHAG